MSELQWAQIVVNVVIATSEACNESSSGDVSQSTFDALRAPPYTAVPDRLGERAL